MNRLKQIAVKMAVSCVGLLFLSAVIGALPPVKVIHPPWGLTIDRVLETFFLTLIALAVWTQSRPVAAELEAVFTKVPVLRDFWENLRLFVFFFLLYRAFGDFLPLLFGAATALFSWGFIILMLYPIVRIAWHGYKNLDLISDGNTWTRLSEDIRQCPKCGALNASEASFCRKCGAPLAVAAPAKTICVCGAEVPPTDSFCAKCGRPPVPGDAQMQQPPPPPPRPAAISCPSCSAPIPAASQFCGKCGTKI